MVKCKNCLKEVDELFDKEICIECNDKWLDDVLKVYTPLEIKRLRRIKEFKQEIGVGENGN